MDLWLQSCGGPTPDNPVGGKPTPRSATTTQSRAVYRWLSLVYDHLSQVKAPRVLLAVATGTSLNPVREKRAQRASWTERCLRVVIVTDNPNWLDARLQLAETVFGPAFSEFGHLPQYETWSVDRFMAERTANTPAWRSLGAGVLLAGSLEEAFR